MASAARRQIRDATAYAAYMVAREQGDLASWKHRNCTAIDVYVIPGSESEVSQSELGFENDIKGRDFVLPSDQAGVRARAKAKALTSNVVTLTTIKAHGFVVGQSIRVCMDTTDSAIDGAEHVITAVPSTTTLQYASTASDVVYSSAGGDVEAMIRPGDLITHEGEDYDILSVEANSLRATYRLRGQARRVRHGGTGA